MRECHSGAIVATLAEVSCSGFPKYRTINPTNDGILFPKLLSMKPVSLDDVLVQFFWAFITLGIFINLNCLGVFKRVL